MRSATVHRQTKETALSVEIDLDGTGLYDVRTGIGFLDHMLEQLSRHSLIDIALAAGFFDQSHFARAFKAQMGMTPTQYRTTLRPG